MLRRNNKKGFTLAELLIVVAIIAVLVAIAVPLFVTGLKKAEEARDNANVRSVKSAAVVFILNTKANSTTGQTPTVTIYNSTSKELFDHFKIVATVTAKGDITFTSIVGQATAYTKTDEGAVPAGDNWTVTAYIDSIDLTISDGE